MSKKESFLNFFKKNTAENKEDGNKITKIHFLVHPGYILESELARKNYIGLERLLEKYIKKAKSLKKNELMVIFAPKFEEDFINDVREKVKKNTSKKYIETIRKIVELLSDPTIKGVVGNRAIVLADTDEFIDYGAKFLDNRNKIWNKISNIASKRGFVFAENVEAQAYGEYKSLCVTQIARNMRFAKDSPIYGPVEIEHELTEEVHKYPDWILRKNPEN